MVDACGAILPRVASTNIRDFARATSIVITYTARVSHITGTREGTAWAHVARPVEKVIPKGTFGARCIKSSFTGTCVVTYIWNPTFIADTGEPDECIKDIFKVTSIVGSDVPMT